MFTLMPRGETEAPKTKAGAKAPFLKSMPRAQDPG